MLLVCLTNLVFHPRITHFSKEPWHLLLENGFRNKGPGAQYKAFILFSFLFENNFKLTEKLQYSINYTHLSFIQIHVLLAFWPFAMSFAPCSLYITFLNHLEHHSSLPLNTSEYICYK